MFPIYFTSSWIKPKPCLFHMKMNQVSWLQLKWDQPKVKWSKSDMGSVTCRCTLSFVFNVAVKQTLPTIDWSTIDWSKLKLGNFEDEMQAFVKNLQLCDDEKKQDWFMFCFVLVYFLRFYLIHLKLIVLFVYLFWSGRVCVKSKKRLHFFTLTFDYSITVCFAINCNIFNCF